MTIIKPFPHIEQAVDELKRVILKYKDYNRRSEDNFGEIKMSLYEKSEEEYIHPNDGERSDFNINITYRYGETLAQGEVELLFYLNPSPYSPYSNDSEFGDWLSSDIYEEYKAETMCYQIPLEHVRKRIMMRMEMRKAIDELAEILTRIVSVFGNTKTTDWGVHWVYNCTLGDLSLAEFPDTVPSSKAIQNALGDVANMRKIYGNYEHAGIGAIICI